MWIRTRGRVLVRPELGLFSDLDSDLVLNLVDVDLDLDLDLDLDP